MRLVTTHDEYTNALHPDFKRIIRGKKHALVFDRDGTPHWVPVKIIKKRRDEDVDSLRPGQIVAYPPTWQVGVDRRR